MTGREIIMALIDTTEMNPEIVKLMGFKLHTTEELRLIIKGILTNSNNEKRERIVHSNFTFGGLELQDK